MAVLPTKRVRFRANPGQKDPIAINASDFDQALHEEWVGPDLSAKAKPQKSDPAPKPPAEPDAPVEEEQGESISDLSANDAQEAIAEIDDVALLKAARNEERKNKGRKTVLSAIDRRLAELK